MKTKSFPALDTNGNGDLDYDELSGGIGKGPFVGWLRLLTAIRVIDRSGDSLISAEELQGAPGHLKRLDRDGNWKLTADELDDSRRTRVGSYGIVQLVDWDGNVVWEYERCIVGQHCLHHDIEPMPNGNTLITNSHNMRIFEVTPDNEVVMDFVLEHLLPEELGHVGGRIWRTFKLPADYPGLARRL